MLRTRTIGFEAASWVLLVSFVCLSTGSLELGGHGCRCDHERSAALHEEHDDGDSCPESTGAEATDPDRGEPDHPHDVCPPFDDDCMGCSSCFHPLAIAAPSLVLASVRFPLGRPQHVIELRARPALWDPSPPQAVPRPNATI